MMPNQRQIGNQGDGREGFRNIEGPLPLYSLPAAAAAVALAACLHTAGVHAAPSQAQTHESASASATPVSAEQRQVASFVAKKYRLAVDEVQEFVAHAYHAASELRLDPLLVLAIVSIESSFDPNARSPKGAQGLMQVLTRVHTDKFAPFGGPRAAFDPLANLKVGSQILKDYLVREGGSIERALKSYVGAAMLPHDYGYGRKVLSERERLAKAAGVKTPPGKSLRAEAEPEKQAAPPEKEGVKKENLAARQSSAQPGPEVATAATGVAATGIAAAGVIAPDVIAPDVIAPKVIGPDAIDVSASGVIDVSGTDAAAAKRGNTDRGDTDAGSTNASVTKAVDTKAVDTDAGTIGAPVVPAAPAAAAPEALPALAVAPTSPDLVPAFTASDAPQETELPPQLLGTSETLVQDSGSPANALHEFGDFAEL